jgi:hypothetical protein
MTVEHSVGEYVNERMLTNSMASFWSVSRLKCRCVAVGYGKN